MKTFKELTIVTPNKPGTLAQVLRSVAQAGVNLIAIDSSSGYDLNMVRLITSDPQATTRVLEKLKYQVAEADVLGVTILDKPGLLAQVAAAFGKAKVNINYMYATAAVSGQEAMVMFQVSDLSRGVRALKAAKIA
ncbi:MAG TPA: ACT domain-containing protein [Verrucomicrobiae bacterium]|nr:ACT domain-containing protein [Verrucomicrobiae bacterium]